MYSYTVPPRINAWNRSLEFFDLISVYCNGLFIHLQSKLQTRNAYIFRISKIPHMLILFLISESLIFKFPLYLKIYCFELTPQNRNRVFLSNWQIFRDNRVQHLALPKCWLFHWRKWRDNNHQHLHSPLSFSFLHKCKFPSEINLQKSFFHPANLHGSRLCKSAKLYQLFFANVMKTLVGRREW